MGGAHTDLEQDSGKSVSNIEREAFCEVAVFILVSRFVGSKKTPHCKAYKDVGADQKAADAALAAAEDDTTQKKAAF